MFASTTVGAGLAECYPLDGAEDGTNGFLPCGIELRDLLGSNINDSVVDILERTLLHPVRDLTTHHGKRIRGQLVMLGHRLVGGFSPSSLRTEQQCRTCVEVVEFIHAGSHRRENPYLWHSNTSRTATAFLRTMLWSSSRGWPWMSGALVTGR